MPMLNLRYNQVAMGHPDPIEPRKRRMPSRSPWGCSPLTCLVSALGFIALFGILHSYMNLQVDPQGCKTPGMRPTYVKLVGFDSEHTRFASKYSMYLYRERGIDEYNEDDIGLRGVPVLFLPGNAGSYKQGRSLASEAAYYYHNVLRHDQERLKAGGRSLDFFLADFNEDMAAFHGQTLLDQAEYVNDALAYIVSLYQDPRRPGRDPNLPDPSSVILIGHSMGGIVARAVLTMANYQANTVNTIITMSTPHARPPVTFDSDLSHTYKQVNSYWREAYSQRWANNNPLWHVTLVSIAGGGGDSIVPSDYTSLSSLVPETHGFTVFATTMPNVWTGMDHLSIAWCDSFRKTVVHSLFDVIDVRRPTQTKQRADRMSYFKKWYLTGMESDAERMLSQTSPTTLLTLEENGNSILKKDERLTLRRLGGHHEPRSYLLPVPPRNGAPGKKFTLLTDQKIKNSGGTPNLDVLFCSRLPLRAGQSESLLSLNLDLSGSSAGSTRLVCKSGADDVIHLPASTPATKHPFDGLDPFSYMEYKLEDLEDYQYVAVVDKAVKKTTGWLIAEFSNSSDSVIPTRVGLGRLLTAGLNIKLPAKRPMVTDIKVPALHSSLLAYKLKVTRPACQEKNELFAPFLRQYISEPHESKYFVNLKEADINLHGVAPYMPPHLRGDSTTHGVGFQLWIDPSCNVPVTVSLQPDILGSMGKLAMRYRTVLCAFPLLIVAIVLRKQFKIYDETGVFIGFPDAMDLCLRTSLPVMFLGLSLLAVSLAPTTEYVGLDDEMSDWRVNATETPMDFTKNDLLLGSQDTFFWFLVPLFGLISIAACVVVNYAATILVHILGLLRSLLVSRKGFIKHDDRRTSFIFPTLTPSRRAINTLVLLFLVSTVMPYQFAYIVACMVQLITCVYASRLSRDMRSIAQDNFYNYAHSILILMLWILPVNALVLVVWVHNLTVHWLTPFSSHHNVLSIMPFVLLVETLTSGSMVPRLTTPMRHVTSVLFYVLAAYAAIYGVTYAYLLHHIANLAAAWLVGVHFFAGGFSFRAYHQTSRTPDIDIENEVPIGSDGHVKKLP